MTEETVSPVRHRAQQLREVRKTDYNMNAGRYAFTQINSGDQTIAKSFQYDQGKLSKTPTVFPSVAEFSTQTANSLTDVADFIEKIDTNQALIYGVVKPAYADRTLIASKHELNAASEDEKKDVIERAQQNFDWPDTGLMMVDYDPDDSNKMLKKREYREALYALCPLLREAPHLIRDSGSSYIFDEATGAELRGSSGYRVLIGVSHGALIPAFAEALYSASWAQDYGFVAVSSDGREMPRSRLIDTAVYRTNGVDFIGGCDCGEGLYQQRPASEIFNDNAAPLDLQTALEQTQNQYSDDHVAMQIKTAKLNPQHRKNVEARRAQFQSNLVAKRVAVGVTESDAQSAIQGACERYQLDGDWSVYITETGVFTSVSEILANPGQYHGVMCADPIDPDYDGGRQCAVIYSQQSTPIIFTQHGGVSYRMIDGRVANNSLAAKMRGLIQQQVDPGVELDSTIINDTVLQTILSHVFWADERGKFVVLINDKTICCTEKKLISCFTFHFGAFLDYEALSRSIRAGLGDSVKDIEKKVETQTKEITAKVHKQLIDFIQNDQTGHRVKWREEKFIDEAYIDTQETPGAATIYLAHKPFPDYGTPDQTIVDDYKKHFPEFDEFLDFVVAARFAKTRKQAMLWLKAPSDWGKNFLLDILGNLNSVTWTSAREIEKLFEGAPVAKNPMHFVRSIVLAVDEFKGVKSEFKQLKDEIPVAAKHELVADVPIYAKLFLSAEDVGSLVTDHGVEDQFANRMSLIYGVGTLAGRQVYKRGKIQYFNNLRAYVARYLNRAMEALIALGREQAEEKAQKRLEAFHSAHSLRNHFQSITESLPEIANAFVNWICKERHNEFFDHKDKVLEYDGELYLTSPSKVLDDYLKHTEDRSQISSISYKKSEILKLASADGTGISTHRVEKKPKKCLWLKSTEEEEETRPNHLSVVGGTETVSKLAKYGRTASSRARLKARVKEKKKEADRLALGYELSENRPRKKDRW